MRIQHNIAALNSHRQLTSNNSAVGKNLEKLSSGYRINRAGDDAAGLAISEKMRAQITGLNTASKNAQDGISLVQTAEGAMTEIHSMLNRMTELAGQAANGTYQDLVDRENATAELNSLRDEIDRISEGTNFNGIKLLDGSMGGAQSGAAANIAATGNINAFGVKITGQAGLSVQFASGTQAATTAAWGANGALTITLGQGAAGDITDKDINDAISKATGTKPEGASSVKVSITGGKITTSAATTTVAAVGANQNLVDAAYSSVTVGGVKLTANKGGATYNGTNTITSGATEGVVVNGTSNTFAMNLVGTNSYTASDLNRMMSAAGAEYRFEFDGSMLGSAIGAAGGTNYQTANGAGVAGNGLTLQIGDTADNFNQITVDVASMSANSLGLSTVDIGTQAGAKAAVDVIKKAINTVSSTRGDLGAIQNRLEHTINNLGVTSENMTAAESRIRDVDMAQEMMTYTKNNILTQASQAMLAQANQLPQGVLQLLQ